MSVLQRGALRWGGMHGRPHWRDRAGGGLVLIAWLQQVSPSPALGSGGTGPTAFIVVDDDTIRSPAGVKCRLMGFDAPEVFAASLLVERRCALSVLRRKAVVDRDIRCGRRLVLLPDAVDGDVQGRQEDES